MNLLGKDQHATGMTRRAVLGVTCLAIAAIFLLGNYKRTGELLQLSWRKIAGKKAQVNEVVSQPEAKQPIQSHSNVSVDEMIEVQDGSPDLISESVEKKAENDSPVSATAEMRLEPASKQRVRIPENAVWLTNSTRRGPGVKIAFP